VDIASELGAPLIDACGPDTGLCGRRLRRRLGRGDQVIGIGIDDEWRRDRIRID
jgi:hypothetical protein